MKVLSSILLASLVLPFAALADIPQNPAPTQQIALKSPFKERIVSGRLQKAEMTFSGVKYQLVKSNGTSVDVVFDSSVERKANYFVGNQVILEGLSAATLQTTGAGSQDVFYAYAIELDLSIQL